MQAQRWLLLKCLLHSGKRSLALKLTSVPGVVTPSEAFSALDAGAPLLKMFRADVLGVASLKAWRSVLLAGVRIVAVGGAATVAAEPTAPTA